MHRVLVDFPYHPDLPDRFEGFELVLAERVGAERAQTILASKMRRCLAFFRMARDYDYVVPEWNRYGRTFCVMQALRGRRNVVVMECIDFANLHRPTLRTRILKTAARWVSGPAMRRSVARIQMMTDWEIGVFAKLYGLPRSLFTAIPWPLSYSPQRVERLPEAEPRYVFASGRACCDWPTVFAAARQGGWPLTVVCAGKDLDAVCELNASMDGRARVLSDIAREEHDRLMAEAAVIAISLEERMTSAGQIRLGEAISAGVPVVATAIRGLDGYLIDDVTGRAVPVADGAAMAAAVADLLADPLAAAALADRARRHARPFTRQAYFAAVAEMVDQLP